MKVRSWDTSRKAPGYSARKRLQPLDGRQVEVVGRLVQQQQIRASAPAPWPAPAARARRPTAWSPAGARSLSAKPTSAISRLHPRLDLVAARAGVALLQLAVAGQIGWIARRPAGPRARSARRAGRAARRTAPAAPPAPLPSCPGSATGAGSPRVALPSTRTSPAVRLQLARQQLQRRRLARCRSAPAAPAARPAGSAATRPSGCRCRDTRSGRRRTARETWQK